MRNVQSSSARLHKNLGKQHDLVFPLLLTAAQRPMAPGDILASTAPTKLCFWLILHFCLKREDLTQSSEVRSCSKAAWTWEGGCFTATLQGIWIDSPFQSTLIWTLNSLDLLCSAITNTARKILGSSISSFWLPCFRWTFWQTSTFDQSCYSFTLKDLSF